MLRSCLFVAHSRDFSTHCAAQIDTPPLPGSIRHTPVTWLNKTHLFYLAQPDKHLLPGYFVASFTRDL